MKVYIGFFVVAIAAGTAAAQDTTAPAPPTHPTPPVAVRLATPFTPFTMFGGMATALKNAPFSADEVNESVQVLADGNRIVHNSTGKMYRNTEGRIRRESKGGNAGSFGMSYSIAPSVSIVDPVIRQKYELDSVLKTATIYDMNRGNRIAIAPQANGADLKATEATLAKLRAEGKLTGVTDAKAAEELIIKLKAEGSLDNVQIIAGGQGIKTGIVNGIGVALDAYAASFGAAAKSRYETKSEDLGTRDFDGVTAEGTRRTTIIPADAIGNERPIEVVYERWYSKELGVVVYSKTTDPRTGEQTYKLTNLVRSEPDPSLFAVPTEYKKVGQQGATYRATTVRAEGAKTSTAPRATVAPAKATTGVGRP